jgi:hypothetical protein
MAKKITDYDSNIASFFKDFPINEKDSYIYLRADDENFSCHTEGAIENLIDCIHTNMNYEKSFAQIVMTATLRYIRENKIDLFKMN